MNDLTFIFPIRIDSNERLENVKTNIFYLKKLFNANIIIAEDGTKNNFEDVIKIESNFHHLFYKTKIINNAVKKATTPFVAIIDADLFFSKQDYEEAYLKIKNQEFDFIFSYSGECWNYNRNFINFIKENELQRNNYYDQYKLELMNKNAVGGSIWSSKKNFFEIGGQNENMISWGFEDNEFINRINKLEKTLYRTNGITYHLNHPRTENSSDANPNINNNKQEFLKTNSFSKNQLIEYIKDWKWNLLE